MTRAIRSVYVRMAVDEARVQWDEAGSSARRLLPDDWRFGALAFIPAEGGCVVAALPDRGQRRLGRRLALRRLYRAVVSASRPRNDAIESLRRLFLGASV